MNDAITLEIKPYGAFRQFGDRLTVQVPQNSSVAEIKRRLAEKLGREHADLVSDSVLADDSTILPAEYVMRDATPLSILPPVCGG